jgi:hypothetical protein
MAGGLMQLVAYGAQDIYLTGNPQITFWKVTYRRHTNFAMEAIEQSFTGHVDFGQRVTCVLSRNGDLAYRTYLQVNLPEVPQNGANTLYARWLDYPGERIIKNVDIEIGGQRIDRQYGDWMHIWNNLTLTKDQEKGYNKMIGHTMDLTYLTDPLFEAHDVECEANVGISGQVGAPRRTLPKTTIYVPLQFWFCRNPGLALPLIALQYHEVKINIELRPLKECLFARTSLIKNAIINDATPSVSLSAGSIWVDFIFLDTDERRRMAQNSHEYLIEQLQFSGEESVTGTQACGRASHKIKLHFNHPCKELIWVVQPCRFVECSSDLGANFHLGMQPFNYTDSWDVLPDSYHPFGGQTSITTTPAVGGNPRSDFINNNIPAVGEINAGIEYELFDSASAWTGTIANDWDPDHGGLEGIDQVPPANPAPQTFGVFQQPGEVAQSLVSDAGTYVLAKTAFDLHLWGRNPTHRAKLQINGQDRFAERKGDYFNNVQPYQHHTKAPHTGINVYSFALRPEEHQPSGTCNFSRIDSAILHLEITARTKEARARVYGVNYNVLRIMSGMGGLAYSN